MLSSMNDTMRSTTSSGIVVPRLSLSDLASHEHPSCPTGPDGDLIRIVEELTQTRLTVATRTWVKTHDTANAAA